MAETSRHSCHDSDGTYCGSCAGAYLDASCCNQFVETYTPVATYDALPRTRCKKGAKLGDGIDITVLTSTNMTGADGSKTPETAGQLALHLFGSVLPILLVGAGIFVGIKVLAK